jgi:hypothetical protein
MKLTAVFEKVPEGYIAFVEELPVQTLRAKQSKRSGNLQEAVELVLEANRVLAEEGSMVVRLSVNRLLSPKREASGRHTSLGANGCEFLREGSNHSIYVNRAKERHHQCRVTEINHFLCSKFVETSKSQPPTQHSKPLQLPGAHRLVICR